MNIKPIGGIWFVGNADPHSRRIRRRLDIET
jgi:hypothetical protein